MALSTFLIGDQLLATQCAERLLENSISICGMASHHKKVRQWSEQAGIPCVDSHDTEALTDAVLGQPFDYLFSIAHLRIVPQRLIQHPRRLAINFHDSLLPRYAGLNAPSWALLAGEQQHGITWHEMTPKADRGRVIVQSAWELDDDETALTLNAKCYQAALATFDQIVAAMRADALPLIQQDLSCRTYFAARRRPLGSGILDWSATADAIQRTTRALDFGRPFPNPFAIPKIRVDNQWLIVRSATPTPFAQNRSRPRPGTILSVEGGDSPAVVVASSDAACRLQGIETLSGKALAADALQRRFVAGQTLDVPSPQRLQRVRELAERLSGHEAYWIQQLESSSPLKGGELVRPSSATPDWQHVEMPISQVFDGATDWAGESTRLCVAAWALFLARVTRQPHFQLSYQSDEIHDLSRQTEGLTADYVPLMVAVEPNASVETWLRQFGTQWHSACQRQSFFRDLIARTPTLHRVTTAGPVGVCVRAEKWAAGDGAHDQVALMLQIDEQTGTLRWHYDAQRVAPEFAERLPQRFAGFVEFLQTHPTRPAETTPVLTGAERRQVIESWNDTDCDYDHATTVQHQFDTQVQRTPAAVALATDCDRVTYGQLAGQVNQLANLLRQQGIARGDRVGIMMNREVNMVVALLATLKLGAAYVPLDPDFPSERLRMIAEDAQLDLILAQSETDRCLTGGQSSRLLVDQINFPTEHDAVTTSGESTDLAYVIFTSGSTGRPKGVPITQRNVVNFLSAMDAWIPHDVPGTWLAVTSLSFDISVLELLWTLTRGFKVVLYHKPRAVSESSDESRRSTSTTPRSTVQHRSSPRRRAPASDVDFSLFYFSSAASQINQPNAGKSSEGVGPADGPAGDACTLIQRLRPEASDTVRGGLNGNTAGGNAYRLLLEGAKFADRNGFSAIWTPERHFHDFGGLYPNPSVTGAAVAAVTQHVGIRSGSVVLPLHHPARVVEEWSVVDNLSGGRVGISFASGWQPRDFVLRPENARDSRQVLFRDLDVVCRLWRGEQVEFPGTDGELTAIQTQPRPIQPELPVWITTAGNPETFRRAGSIGANLLTHLLGQSIDELAEKIAIYREARVAAGYDPSTAIVSVMLHTLVGPDTESVRQLVHDPLTRYLESSVNLIKGYSQTWAAFKKRKDGTAETQFDLDTLSSDERDDMLAFARERYFESSGLFGSPEKCLALVRKLSQVGVNDLACLIDFGVSTDVVLHHLPYLNELRSLVGSDHSSLHPTRQASNLARTAADNSSSSRSNATNRSLADWIRRHSVTHLQWTPSMAAMYLEDAETVEAIRSLDFVLVGGEALPVSLASQLCETVDGTILNMYGPTETTVWSAVAPVQPVEHGSSVSIGRPVANTQIYILDEHLEPVFPLMPGELWIGGDGVAPGYLDRDDLTADRFHTNPFRPGGRIYRTGDLASWTVDGNLEFHGRADFQIKLRGYRIELGEIENLMATLTGIKQAVVVAREDQPGDVRLVGYYVAESDELNRAALKTHLERHLPEYMRPTDLVQLSRFPLTPNAKIDRNALPEPQRTARSGGKPNDTSHLAARPNSKDVEQKIMAIWGEVLRIADIRAEDNFFELGGHSLLAVRAHRKLREELATEISITDLFRFPTVRSLANHLETESDSSDREESSLGQQRAQRRQLARMRRRKGGMDAPSLIRKR